MLDVISIRTAYNLSKEKGEAGSEIAAIVAEYLKTNYLYKGNLGMKSGQGFYKFPNPAYKNDDFLT